LDAKETGLRVGSEVAFDVNYSALLRAMTSPYVAKEYVGHPTRMPPLGYNPQIARGNDSKCVLLAE